MTSRFEAAIAAAALAVTIAGCAADDELVGEAEEAVWGTYRITNLVVKAGSSYVADPRTLLESAEAWGPQTMLLAIDRHLTPQVSIQRQPGVQLAKDKLTKTLQDAVGFSLSTDTEFTASSSTVVEEGWYERLEAYPTFQTVTWDLVQDGAWGPTLLARGSVQRPIGVYFRVVVIVRGKGKEGGSERDREPGSITAIGRPGLGFEAIRE